MYFYFFSFSFFLLFPLLFFKFFFSISFSLFLFTLAFLTRTGQRWWWWICHSGKCGFIDFFQFVASSSQPPSLPHRAIPQLIGENSISTENCYKRVQRITAGIMPESVPAADAASAPINAADAESIRFPPHGCSRCPHSLKRFFRDSHKALTGSQMSPISSFDVPLRHSVTNAAAFKERRKIPPATVSATAAHT